MSHIPLCQSCLPVLGGCNTSFPQPGDLLISGHSADAPSTRTEASSFHEHGRRFPASAPLGVRRVQSDFLERWATKFRHLTLPFAPCQVSLPACMCCLPPCVAHSWVKGFVKGFVGGFRSKSPISSCEVQHSLYINTKPITKFVLPLFFAPTDDLHPSPLRRQWRPPHPCYSVMLFGPRPQNNHR